MNTLEIRNLCVDYITPTGILRAVDDVSFSIARGETLGLVGESGCGKTTVARTLMGLESATSGDIHFFPATAQASVQMVFQDPFSALNPRMTVLDLITEAAVVHGVIKRTERIEKGRALLADVGLPGDILHRYPHAFSGGQRQRLCIARALSLNPELLVCDEPVSALDVTIQAQIIDLLLKLRQEHNLSMLFISHDLFVVRRLAHRIAVMRKGRIVEMGETEQVTGRPQNEYTKTLLAAVLD